MKLPKFFSGDASRKPPAPSVVYETCVDLVDGVQWREFPVVAVGAYSVIVRDPQGELMVIAGALDSNSYFGLTKLDALRGCASSLRGRAEIGLLVDDVPEREGMVPEMVAGLKRVGRESEMLLKIVEDEIQRIQREEAEG